MHGAAVVPEDEVARTPLVGIDDVGTGRILAELLQECRALLRRQSLDADREAGAHIERLAAGHGMGTADRMRHLRDFLELILAYRHPLAAFGHLGRKSTRLHSSH